MLVDFLNSFNVGIRKKWLITRMNLYNNAILLSDAKFKQNMTKKVTKS